MLLSADDKLKQILYHEHNNVKDNSFRKVPILVEDTEMGADINRLLRVISGYQSVEAYNFVSFRVLHRLANLMSGKLVMPEEVYEGDWKDPYEGVLKENDAGHMVEEESG